MDWFLYDISLRRERVKLTDVVLVSLSLTFECQALVLSLLLLALNKFFLPVIHHTEETPISPVF